ncbi:hypothetical protein [Roseisolibacter agri]|uniref:Uncharacterized protein n=1 Tax=Roseisolibacter agri TaxID=2014610 RepID=A0AA37Q7I1_9BACT|nr:hypothetical protein [Roseisolibacter agri]GLC23796.1 hypothetical protein rosag_03090 [Roseisolibacter agri]
MSPIETSVGTAPLRRDPMPRPPLSLFHAPGWLGTSLAARLDSAVALNAALRRTRRTLIGERRRLLAARHSLLAEAHRELGRSDRRQRN